MIVCGKGSIDIDDGAFHDGVCVPSLSSNLLSIYQITHSGTGKIVEFAQDSVHIRDSETGNVVVIGTIDHSPPILFLSFWSTISTIRKSLFFHGSHLR